MARYSATWTSITPTATADATNLADSTYPVAIQGGSSTMVVKVNEVFVGGEASASSSPTIIVLARDSQVGSGTLGAGTTRSAALDGSTVAPGTLPAIFHTAATNKPQRSATLHLLHLSFNAYGGVVRWQARHGEEISIVGNTASLGEASLSAFTGGTPGATSGHVVYEVV